VRTEAVAADIIERQFGARLREIRTNKKIPQAALAARMTALGWTWHQSTVHRVEAGSQPVRLGEAASLAAILATDLNSMASGIPLPPCVKCGDSPPGGFTCNSCGKVTP